MYKKVNRVSSEAVEQATGKSWAEWIELLSEQCTTESTHKDMVRILKETGGLENGWWQQTIAVGYEIVRGSRVLGETANAGFEVGVQKTVDLSPQQTWQLLTSRKGLLLWLGEVDDLNLVKGEKFQTKDGSSGEIRSIKRAERIRIKWQPNDGSNSSTFQITLSPVKNKTSIRVHHENLSRDTSRSEMQKRWRTILEKINESVSD